MRRTYILLAAAVAAAASGAAVASANGRSSTAHAARAAKVELRHTRLGPILATASGLTLFEFTRDRTNQDTCVKISGCSETWPALQTSGTPSAGPGVKASLLSTIRLSGGGKQVAYAGHALYLYTGDTQAGDTSYVGERAFGGTWYAINAAAHTVK